MSREEERATSLYKAWKPVPPPCICHWSSLLPHWDFQTVSLCPPHLLITAVRGVPEVFWSAAVLSYLSSPSPCWTERTPTRYPASRRESPRWRHLRTVPATCWLLAAFLGTRLKMPEPTKKGRSVDSQDGISRLTSWFNWLHFFDWLIEFTLRCNMFRAVRLCRFMFACLLSLTEGSRQVMFAAGKLHHFNSSPASLFMEILKVTLTVVLYFGCMRVSTILGGRRRFEVYEQILLLLRGFDALVMQLGKKTRWWSAAVECWWVPSQTRNPWRMMQLGWTERRLGLGRMNNNLTVVVSLMTKGLGPVWTPQTCPPRTIRDHI